MVHEVSTCQFTMNSIYKTLYLQDSGYWQLRPTINKDTFTSSDISDDERNSSNKSSAASSPPSSPGKWNPFMSVIMFFEEILIPTRNKHCFVSFRPTISNKPSCSSSPSTFCSLNSNNEISFPSVDSRQSGRLQSFDRVHLLLKATWN